MMKHHRNLQGIIEHVHRLEEDRKEAKRRKEMTEGCEDYKWFECVNWIESQQERWEKKCVEDHAQGLHDIV